jgi:hypothetical protein
MIKALRNLADWLEKVNCNIHYWWNSILECTKIRFNSIIEHTKIKCQCERLQK